MLELFADKCPVAKESVLPTKLNFDVTLLPERKDKLIYLHK